MPLRPEDDTGATMAGQLGTTVWRITVHFGVDADQRAALLESLAAIEAPTRVRQGCRDWALYESIARRDNLLLVEEWDSEEAMNAHIRSDEFRVILAVIDASSRQPRIMIESTDSRAGLDYLQTVLARNTSMHTQPRRESR